MRLTSAASRSVVGLYYYVLVVMACVVVYWFGVVLEVLDVSEIEAYAF
jgi:hypothetical protein